MHFSIFNYYFIYLYILLWIAKIDLSMGLFTFSFLYVDFFWSECIHLLQQNSKLALKWFYYKSRIAKVHLLNKFKHYTKYKHLYLINSFTFETGLESESTHIKKIANKIERTENDICADKLHLSSAKGKNHFIILKCKLDIFINFFHIAIRKFIELPEYIEQYILQLTSAKEAFYLIEVDF